jgi:hypothetical protein
MFATLAVYVGSGMDAKMMLQILIFVEIKE